MKNIEQAIKECNLLLAGNIYLEIYDENGNLDFNGTCNKEYNQAIETLLKAYKNIKIQLQEQKNINKKLSLEAQKYFDALMEDEKVIDEMVNYMVQEMAEFQLDDIYAELYNCNGLERNWTRGDIEEIKDILNYFRKKCE